MAKGLIYDRYAFKRMAFARKKPKMGFMNIQNMPKGFPTYQDGSPAPLGVQRFRLASTAHANAGVRGTTMYRGTRIPRIAVAVKASIPTGRLISGNELAQRRQEKLQATEHELQALQQRGFGTAPPSRGGGMPEYLGEGGRYLPNESSYRRGEY